MYDVGVLERVFGDLTLGRTPGRGGQKLDTHVNLNWSGYVGRTLSKRGSKMVATNQPEHLCFRLGVHLHRRRVK